MKERGRGRSEGGRGGGEGETEGAGLEGEGEIEGAGLEQGVAQGTCEVNLD